MRRLIFVVLVLTACGREDAIFTLASAEPPELARGVGGELEAHGVGLERLSVAQLVGAKSVALEVLAAGPVPRLRAPAGLTSGRYDLVMQGAAGETATLPGAIRIVDGELQIEVANVSQGDGGYIRAPNGRTLVIDGGRAQKADGADALGPVLKARGLLRPEFVLVTHLDADHLGGIADFMRGDDGKPCTADDRMPALGLLDYAPAWNSCASAMCLEYYAMRDCNASKMAGGMGWTVPTPGTEIPLGAGVRVKVVVVSGQFEGGRVATGSENSNSIGLLVEFGDFRYFTAGDISGGAARGCDVGGDTADIETPVAKLVGRVDALKIDHHGSCTSTNEGFLRELAPQVAFVSVGENNVYGHPSQDVLDRIDAAGAQTFLTNPGMTRREGNFEPTVLPPKAVRAFGSLRLTTSDGRSFRVSVMDPSGRELEAKTFESRGGR